MSKMAETFKKLARLGKSQARDQFAPLVETLATEGGVIEVTDYGKVAAVMLGYKDYLWLVAQAKEPFHPKMHLAGSAVLVGDLEAASNQISRTMLGSVEKSGEQI